MIELTGRINGWSVYVDPKAVIVIMPSSCGDVIIGSTIWMRGGMGYVDVVEKPVEVARLIASKKEAV
jgi:hypothetical protein